VFDLFYLPKKSLFGYWVEEWQIKKLRVGGSEGVYVRWGLVQTNLPALYNIIPSYITVRNTHGRFHSPPPDVISKVTPVLGFVVQLAVVVIQRP
jgi:hypothetical protein